MSINKSLTSLNLSSNYFDDPIGLTNSIINHNSLTDLDISYTNLSAENVSNIISKCTNLSNLNIYNNSSHLITDDNYLKVISKPLKFNTNLQLLELNCNNVNNLNILTDALINNSSLHSLYLYNINWKDTKEEFLESNNLKAIINLIENNKYLSTLYCIRPRCWWSDVYDELLLKALNKNTSLINLIYN